MTSSWLWHPISRLRVFTKFAGKTSYRLVKRGSKETLKENSPRRELFYSQDLGKIGAWIGNCSHDFLPGVITHPLPNFNGISVKLGCRWVNTPKEIIDAFKDRAHLSTFKFFIFEKFSCFIVLVVFLVIVQSSELISVWFCEKMTFKFFY